MTTTQERLNKIEKELAESRKKQDEIYNLLITGEIEGSLIDDIHYIIQINKRQQTFMTKQQNEFKNLNVDYKELSVFVKEIGMMGEFEKRQVDKEKAQQKLMEELQRKQIEAQKKAQLQREGSPDGKTEDKEEEKQHTTDQ